MSEPIPVVDGSGIYRKKQNGCTGSDDVSLTKRCAAISIILGAILILTGVLLIAVGNSDITIFVGTILIIIAVVELLILCLRYTGFLRALGRTPITIVKGPQEPGDTWTGKK